MQTRSTPLSIDVSASRILTDLEARVLVEWNGRQGFRHGQALTSAEREHLGALVSDLDRLIRSPLRVDTARAAARKLSTMGGARDTRDADAFVGALVDALLGLPDAAIEEASRRITAGEEPTISPKFMPTTAEVATLARRIVAGWQMRRDRLAQIAELAERPTEPKAETFTEAQMARMRAMSERLTAAAAMTSTARAAIPGRQSAAGRVAADIARRKAGRQAEQEQP